MVFVFPSSKKEREIHPQGTQSGIDRVLFMLQRIDRQVDLSFASVSVEVLSVSVCIYRTDAHGT